VPLSAAIAGLIALSDERDMWLVRLGAEFRLGWRLGREAGLAEGRAQAEAADEAWWRDLAARVAHGEPPYSEMDRRRYPPGGRLSWIRKHPGDDAA
jgi:hypothetical protein